MALLPVDEALARILANVPTMPAEHVDLLHARQRILAEPLTAGHDQPPFDASAMDGYAVRRADVERLPATLRVVGESAAGRSWRGTLGSGEAIRIFTGAPMPAGADAVVIQENTRRDGHDVVIAGGDIDPGHVRRRACDFAQGDSPLGPGVRLGARSITLAAAMGHAMLPVRRRPVVAIIATGDELVPPGVAPGPDQIVCSNPYGMAALAEAAGAEARILGIAPDTRAALAAKLDAAAGADIVVTIGGASVGDHDLVAPVLKERGVVLDFWNIAMRPGKPLMHGRLAGQHVLGMPGNPVSALICGRVFLVPLIARMLGIAADDQLATARTAHPIEPNGPRQHYMRAVLDGAGSNRKVRLVRSQDSSLLSPLAEANCLVVRAPGAPMLAAGSSVAILPLDF